MNYLETMPKDVVMYLSEIIRNDVREEYEKCEAVYQTVGDVKLLKKIKFKNFYLHPIQGNKDTVEYNLESAKKRKTDAMIEINDCTRRIRFIDNKYHIYWYGNVVMLSETQMKQYIELSFK